MLDLSQLLLAAVVLAVGVAVLALVVRLLQRRRPRGAASQPHLAVDLSQLNASGPPPAGPNLEFYGTPVRLAVIVLAPVGRGGQLPPEDLFPQLFEQLIPRCADVVASHQPLIRSWPEQLSSQGFTHAFFNQVPLPGDRGKGTIWCSVAGKFQALGRPFLAGIVVAAAEPNGLGQFTIEHDGQWNDILRVRS